MALALVTAALARDAGLSISPDHIAAWHHDEGMVLYETADPFTPVHAFTWTGRVCEVAEWQGVFLAIVEELGQRQLFRIDPVQRTAERVGDVGWVQALAVDPDTGDLVLIDAAGAIFQVDRLEPKGRWWASGVRELGSSPPPVLGVRTNRVLADPRLGLIASSPVGLFIADQPTSGDARVIQGVGPNPIENVAVVNESRLVTVEQDDDDRWVVTRWSLLHPWSPWPFPVGTFPLPGDYVDLISIPGGAWVLGPGPLQSLPDLPGVLYGQADPTAPTPVAAGLWSPPGAAPVVVLVDADLSLRLIAPPQPPPIGPAHTGDGTRLAVGDWEGWAQTLGPPDPEVYGLRDRLRLDDLPMGLEASPGGTLPAWGRESIQQLVAIATPLNRVPLVVARSYLTRFPDPDGEMRVLLESRETELRARAVTFWGGLMVLGSLAIWLWRWASRRILLRDQVLATAYNPFRQDSPNNPARTPFAANSLADDLLRTLDLNCVVVEGPQFSGKSALLRHVAWRLESEGLRDKPVRVVRMSLFAVPEERFWTELGRQIAEVYPHEEASEEIRELSELDRGAVEYLLDEVLVDGAPRLVLVLDDLDTMGTYQSEAQRFRGLLQVVPSHRMAVLGAGMSIRRGFAGSDDESPWFNLFQVRLLRPMSHEELIRYLDSRLEPPFSYTPEAATRLHELTEGRPLQVWHLCFAGVEQLLVGRRFDLQVRDVEAASEELRTLAGVFTRRTGEPAALAAGPEAAWEQVVQRVAEARRRRSELLQVLAERQQREQAEAIESFFNEQDP
ncbi:MAG: ATP-binding protein [Alphaproteobacteria bacterium]|nr:ATP-binding protein [Alphaproteobacteria bacterium]